ncbi:MAG: hypothetical protein ACOVQ5_10435 [Flavobacteriales bacterium]|jgi:hypothetical protein
MKTKHLLLFLVLCCSAALHAQNEKQMLSVEFGYGINQFDMGSINQFYIDSFAAKPSVDLLEERITSGQHFRLGINYRPMGLFDFGFYGSYQYGNSESNITSSITDETGAPISKHNLSALRPFGDFAVKKVNDFAPPLCPYFTGH